MNLNTLLAVGRSFVGGKDTPGRFKMTTQNLLPDFNPARRSVVAAEPLAGSGGGEVTQGSTDGAEAPMESAEAEVRPNPFHPTTVAEPIPKLSGGSVTAAGNAVAECGREEVRKPSFERVRVVRNDLSDSDLEVISVTRSLPEVQREGGGEEPVQAGPWRQVVSRVLREVRLGV